MSEEMTVQTMRPIGSEPPPGLGSAFGVALEALAGCGRESPAALRPASAGASS